MSSYVKLYRAIQQNSLLARDNTAYILFTKLLVSVDWRTGEMLTGKQKLAALTNLKPTTVYSALKRLKEAHMVEVFASKGYSRIQVVNWGKYQSETDHSSSTAQPQTDRQTTEEKTESVNHSSSVRQPQLDTINKNNNNKYINISSTDVDLKQLFYELVSGLGFSDQVRFLPDRQKKLKSRLRGYTPDQLKDAASKIVDSPWHQGDNPSGKRYGTIDFLLESDKRVDEWLNTDNKKVTYKADW